MLAGAMAMAVEACGNEDQVANQPSNIVGAVDNVEIETLPADESDATPTDELATGVDKPGDADGIIPVALQGRWGMSPQDCTSTRGDTKGLITVTSDRIRFYESTARPSSDAHATADSVLGNFDFTGEGRSWTRHQMFKIQDGNLVRTESDPMSSFTYVPCR